MKLMHITVLALAAALGFSACGGDTAESSGNTNWQTCSTDTDCEGARCECGVCSPPCAGTLDCSRPRGATCRTDRREADASSGRADGAPGTDGPRDAAPADLPEGGTDGAVVPDARHADGAPAPDCKPRRPSELAYPGQAVGWVGARDGGETDAGGASCSGFLVSDALVLVPAHCVESREPSELTFQFDPWDRYEIQSVPEIRNGGLDYAILCLARRPARTPVAFEVGVWLAGPIAIAHSDRAGVVAIETTNLLDPESMAYEYEGVSSSPDLVGGAVFELTQGLVLGMHVETLPSGRGRAMPAPVLARVSPILLAVGML